MVSLSKTRVYDGNARKKPLTDLRQAICTALPGPWQSFSSASVSCWYSVQRFDESAIQIDDRTFSARIIFWWPDRGVSNFSWILCLIITSLFR